MLWPTIIWSVWGFPVRGISADDFELTLSGDQTIFNQGENIAFIVTLENQSGRNLKVAYFSFGGKPYKNEIPGMVWRDDSRVLGPNIITFHDSKTLQDSWHLGYGVEPGTYQITAEVSFYLNWHHLINRRQRIAIILEPITLTVL